MTAGTIVLLRHARTAYNAGLRLQGQIDIPLDEVGRWQAEQGATALAASHKGSLVVASDLQRARDTAVAYARHVGLEVVTDAGLRERSFGIWEGLTDTEIAERWPEEHAVWRSGGEPPAEGVEPKDVVARRMEEAVLRHAEALSAGETLVVVSHGSAITQAVIRLLGLDPATWRGLHGLHNVHWSHLRASGPGATPEWRLVAHNVGAGYPLDTWQSGPEARQ
ncbi:histidine phosphatase family protein [Promicromonospora vindobonensis]|uniref:Histidine phosphatase family protein n=1 Tax=Promicromonospora vindobonensis TaxID=195748 RepID=A0ABW5VPD9_9MICO